MGGSDAEWGTLASQDDDLAEVWDGFSPLPGPGENPALDALVARKHLTIGDLVRLGARLAAPDVIAFAFPGGIKYRSLLTDQRWSYAGSSWKYLKIVPGHDNTTVIVAEGETDGARLSSVYDCDVAVLPAGADPRPHAADYAKQLSDYELVLLGHDDDAAGHAGAGILAELLPQSRLFTAPANDWCEATTFPPLPAPEPLDRAGGLVFESLRSLLEGGVPDPEQLVEDMLYTEGVHWIAGHPASGKTTLVMHWSIEIMGTGRHVVWIDYEGGIRPTARRLLACGCPPELVERFHYAGWPKDAIAAFGDVAARWPGALIVLDSASKALSMAGVDEDRPAEVTKWVAPIVSQCKAHSLPVIIIDHVTKSASATTRYARGAGSKLADADVAWFVEKRKPFSRSEVGLICVHQQKDREGFLPETTWYEVGDGAGKLTLTLSHSPDEDAPPV